MNLTRQAALSTARYVYGYLAERARAASDDPDTVDAIYAAWREKLDSLMSFRSDPVLSTETNRAVAGLMDAVMRTPTTDGDALIRWLDVYPSAIAELFPPSESTFSLHMEDSGAEAVASTEERVEAGEFALVA